VKEKKEIVTTDKDQRACLFSNHVSESIEENLKFMEKKYGFFIIDVKSCKDKQGLLKYLGELIHVQKKCIGCDQIFKSGRDCQQHMIDKQHVFMDPDDFEQYDKFYDFTEENRKVAKRIQEKFGHLKSHDNEFMFRIGDDKIKAVKAQAEGEEDWEDYESGDEVSEMTEGGETKRVKKSKNEFYTLRKAKILSTGELRLPSGRIAGHRDYMRFYKQSLRAEKEDGEHKALMRDRAMQRTYI
jgi:pre-60S factor REI1